MSFPRHGEGRSKFDDMKNTVSAGLFPIRDLPFTRAGRKTGWFILVACLLLVHLPGYSQPEAKCDTLGDAVVVFRPRAVADNNMPMEVTVTRAGEASSREDCIRQLEESPYDKQTVARFNCDAVHAVRTAEAEDRIRNAILSAMPEEKLHGIRHLVMNLILSPSGQIECVSFYPTETMLQRWTAADYETLDRMLKSGAYYASWDEPIPCCCLMESIPLADDGIHAIITVDEHFSKLTLRLTNRFEDEVWWSSSPLLAETGNTGIKVDFRDRSGIVATWTYPLQAVGEPFYSAFPVEPLETVRMEADLADFSRKLGDTLESIEVTVGFLMAHPATGKGYRVLDSFVLNRTENSRSAQLNLRPLIEK